MELDKRVNMKIEPNIICQNEDDQNLNNAKFKDNKNNLVNYIEKHNTLSLIILKKI